MAIEKCSNCLKDIGQLEQAYICEGKIVCESCNTTLNKSNTNNPSQSKVQTIEKTGKEWKGLILIGAILIIIGIPAICAGSNTFGVAFLVVGLILLLYGKIGGWWEHG